MLDFTNLEGARVAFKQLYNQVQSFLQWDARGNQIHNVGSPLSPTDAVNLQKLTDAINNLQTAAANSSPQLAQAISTLIVSTLIKPQVDNTVDLGTAALAFKKGYLYGLRLNSLTASRPLKLDASNDVISAKIDLADTTRDVTGVLKVANGGTNVNTLTADQPLLANGAGTAVTQLAGTTGALTLTPTTGTQSSTNGTQAGFPINLQYKDWAGTNQTVTVITSVILQSPVVTSVTLEASPLTAVALTTNAFTKGIRTT